MTAREMMQIKKNAEVQYSDYNVVSIEIVNARQTVHGSAGVSVFIQATADQLQALITSPNCNRYEAASWDAENNVTEYDVFLWHGAV